MKGEFPFWINKSLIVCFSSVFCFGCDATIANKGRESLVTPSASVSENRGDARKLNADEKVLWRNTGDRAPSDQLITLNSFGLVGDGRADDGAAIQAVIDKYSGASGDKQVTFVLNPSLGKCFRLENAISLPANAILQGLGAPSICTSRSSGTVFKLSNNNVKISGLTLDASTYISDRRDPIIRVDNSTGLALTDLKIINASEGIEIQGAENFTITRVTVNGSRLHGIWISSSKNATLSDLEFEGVSMFAITLRNETNHVSIRRASAKRNGLELLGATYDTFDNELVESSIDGSGDNCVSITGSRTLVARNTLSNCAGNGLNLYGEHNIAVGNHVKNNSQKNSSNLLWRAGLAIAPGFGGTGQFNAAFGNLIDDDQPEPTQVYGVWISRPIYSQLSRSQTVRQGSFRIENNLLLRAETAGVTDASAPHCDFHSPCTDGSVVWRLVKTFETGDQRPAKNILVSNIVGRSREKNFADFSSASDNVVSDSYGHETSGLSSSSNHPPTKNTDSSGTKLGPMGMRSLAELVPLEFRSSFCKSLAIDSTDASADSYDCVQATAASHEDLELRLPDPFVQGQVFYFLNDSDRTVSVRFVSKSSPKDAKLSVPMGLGTMVTWDSATASWRPF